MVDLAADSMVGKSVSHHQCLSVEQAEVGGGNLGI